MSQVAFNPLSSLWQHPYHRRACQQEQHELTAGPLSGHHPSLRQLTRRDPAACPLLVPPHTPAGRSHKPTCTPHASPCQAGLRQDIRQCAPNVCLGKVRSGQVGSFLGGAQEPGGPEIGAPQRLSLGHTVWAGGMGRVDGRGRQAGCAQTPLRNRCPCAPAAQQEPEQTVAGGKSAQSRAEAVWVCSDRARACRALSLQGKQPSTLGAGQSQVADRPGQPHSPKGK